jgi:hypothetical protein
VAAILGVVVVVVAVITVLGGSDNDGRSGGVRGGGGGCGDASGTVGVLKKGDDKEFFRGWEEGRGRG